MFIFEFIPENNDNKYYHRIKVEADLPNDACIEDIFDKFLGFLRVMTYPVDGLTLTEDRDS